MAASEVEQQQDTVGPSATNSLAVDDVQEGVEIIDLNKQPSSKMSPLDASVNDPEAAMADSSPSSFSSTATSTKDDPKDSNNGTINQQRKERWYNFDGVRTAKGYNLNGIGRGALVMSNIFLANSFLYLANDEAGCLDDDGEYIEDCSNKVNGFRPASFLANIAMISGLLSAILMPWIGAIIDYTPHRRKVGIIASVLMIAIQIAQIGTVSGTWFVMSWFQAIAGFLYQVSILAIYAYLPDISRMVGQTKMNNYTSTFTMTQFGSQALFLFVVIILSLILGTSTVVTAQMSQSINVVWSGIFFYISWRYYFEEVPPNHDPPQDTSLFVQSFKQLWHTVKDINDQYKSGLRWYFLTLTFAEASVNAFTTLSVVYLSETTGLDSTEIGVFFFVTLVFSVPGAWLSAKITQRLNPKRSWIWCMIATSIWVAGGAYFVSILPKFVSFLWGAGIGILLGWFYPTENLLFAMILPKGQEAELSGFFVYCSQILGWLPPLIFAAVIEANVSQTVATILIVLLFLPPAAFFMSLSGTFEEILIESGRANTGHSNGDEHVVDEEKQEELRGVSTDGSEVIDQISVEGSSTTGKNTEDHEVPLNDESDSPSGKSGESLGTTNHSTYTIDA